MRVLRQFVKLWKLAFNFPLLLFHCRWGTGSCVLIRRRVQGGNWISFSPPRPSLSPLSLCLLPVHVPFFYGCPCLLWLPFREIALLLDSLFLSSSASLSVSLLFFLLRIFILSRFFAVSLFLSSCWLLSFNSFLFCCNSLFVPLLFHSLSFSD